jgi:hypothetical protein
VTLSKADIDAAIDSAEPATKEVPVPELGGTVVVRELSGTLRNAFEAAVASIATADGERRLNAVTIRVVSECTLDGEGNILLDPDRTRRLFHKKPRAVFRLRDEIIGLSAMDEADLEALVEGFGDDPSEGSTSG